MSKQLCNHKRGDDKYCDLPAGYDTEHNGVGPCQYHDEKSSAAIALAVESPIKSIGDDLVDVEASITTLGPIINRTDSLLRIVSDMINEWSLEDTHKGENFIKFEKMVNSFQKLMNTLEKSVNDANLLEIKKTEIKQREQDWEVAYFVIGEIMQADPVLADKIMARLKRNYGTANRLKEVN